MTIAKRTFEELSRIADPAWPLVRAQIAEATNAVEVLAPAATRAETLVATQVTLHSTLGAIVYETGGVLVDHGWMRLLGSGGDPRLLRTLPSWNFGRGLERDGARPLFVLVADDAVGGFFAIDGGLWGTPHHVHYLAPDTLRWEDTGRGYTDFVRWCLSGDLARFYLDYRWDGWQRDAESLPGDQAYAIVPPPYASGAPIRERPRRRVSVAEIYDLYTRLTAPSAKR